ncbi:MAG TPA: aldehyde dehydrogenase family protein, partial [Clostridiales bacterium]|nr:aldehyde dehydrogenase family protein [Clostridiales bacterium]
RPKPLALYLFTRSRAVEEGVTRRVSYGGGCINDTIVHLASHHLPFGGVGESGMGSYHGKASFDTFTHYKSILKRGTWLDIPLRYRPYTTKALAQLKRIIK